MKKFYKLLALLSLLSHGKCSPEPGIWDFRQVLRFLLVNFSFYLSILFSDLSLENNYVGAVKNAFAKTKVKIRWEIKYTKIKVLLSYCQGYMFNKFL